MFRCWCPQLGETEDNAIDVRSLSPLDAAYVYVTILDARLATVSAPIIMVLTDDRRVFGFSVDYANHRIAEKNEAN